MERYLIQECLDWNLNVTTPYHFSDCIQGMGCLYWSDFESAQLNNFENKLVSEEWYQKLTMSLIQYRKYINYFVEQSLINGMWGNYQHDTIAIASILIARYEM